MSGLARAYAVTGSEPTRAKVNRLVKGYADTLDDKAIFFKGYRLPAYTYDKLSCGLIDAYEFARDPMALDVHEKLTRAVTAYLPEKALSRAEQRMRPHKDTSFTWDETYTLPENLFLAYQRSGKTFYRDMAKQFLEDDTYFNPLAEGYNVLPFEHAYSHVNAFSSAMQAYITLGSEKHLRAARNGFEMVLTAELRHRRLGPERGVRRTRHRAARRQPADVARQLRDAMWRIRSFQDRAVPAADDKGRALRRQHGARALQHHPRGVADPGRRHIVLLLRLRNDRTEGLVPKQVAVLLGHVPPTRRGLPHQHVPAIRRRRLREPVHSVEGSMDRGRSDMRVDAGDQLSVRQQGHDQGVGVVTGGDNVVRANPRRGRRRRPCCL